MKRDELDAMVARGVAKGMQPRSVIVKIKRMGYPMPGDLVDNSEARAHAQALHDYGMSLRQIARLAGTSEGTLSEMLSNTRCGKPHSGKNKRAVVEGILAVEFEDYDTERGAMYPAVGVQRRIGALACAGFNYQYMSRYLGHHGTTRSYVGMLIRNTYVHERTARAVNEMYLKLRDVDPADVGITPHSKALTQWRATQRGDTPYICWDDDAIDNPDAHPEWTGACGTLAGMRIHKRDDIPMCPRCLDARSRERSVKGNNAA